MGDNYFEIYPETIFSTYDVQGVICLGYDWVMELPCQVQFLFDPYSSHTVTLQVFENLTEQQLKRKVSQIRAVASEKYCSTFQKICAYAKTETNLYIIYDYHDTEMSLNTYLMNIQDEKKRIPENEVWELAFTMLDGALMGGIECCEYLTLSPFSIFLMAGRGQKFIISNFGSYCPKMPEESEFVNLCDTFFHKKPEDRTGETIERAFVFKVGLILLYSISGEELDIFYKNVKNLIGTDDINAYIESKTAQFSPKLQKFLMQLMESDEEARPKIVTLMQDQQFIERKQVYFNGKSNKGDPYEGFMIPHSVEHISSGPGRIKGQYNGRFEDALKQGYGILYSKDIEVWGYWNKDKLSNRGVIHKKNEYIFIGKFKKPTLEEGSGSIFKLVGADQTFEDGALSYAGDISAGSISKGVLHLKYGDYEGEFQNWRMNGPGTLTYKGKKDERKYRGEWKNGKRHGKGELLNRKGEIYYEEYDDGKKKLSKKV